MTRALPCLLLAPLALGALCLGLRSDARRMPASATAEDPLARRLMRQSQDAMHFRREEAIYSLKLIGAGGAVEGSRRMRVWFKSSGDEDAKLRIRLMEPSDVRGTGFLTLIGAGGRSKQQWLYLPAYRKTRRIGGGNENEPFLDSDFTLEDVSVESKGRFNYQVTGTRACDGGQCYVLTGTPGAGASASYSRKVLFIRKDCSLNVRTEFYDARNRLRKVLTLQKFHRDAASGRFMADRLEMRDLIANHSTALEIEKRTAGEPADALFTQSALEDGS